MLYTKWLGESLDESQSRSLPCFVPAFAELGFLPICKFFIGSMQFCSEDACAFGSGYI
jgi:hypothetical protein